ncbi:hypothetical protein [Actinopolyspora mortivallis]|uniref:Uncharacterized protein n=1 Tax=Actinopolyspora mortivallis TaxID=33906 RepID=A0A2T0GVP6_ACTMO|nr:hypothetical protein [Actinopolyspora mortivallis]PRW63170.1 hypothetical protein CEP50_11445 [Actinopolyspora mortivallis]
MSGPSSGAVLAELLVRGTWLVEEAAYEVGGRRYTSGQCRDVAAALEELAAALGEHAGRVEDVPAATVDGVGYRGGSDG